VFTLNSSDDDGTEVEWRCPGIDCPVIEWLNRPKEIRYLVCQVESGEETQKAHIQGYLQLDKPCSLSALKLCFGQRVHFEVRHGTHEQARDYCIKEDTRLNGPWEFGEPKTQGKRTDLDTIGQLVRERKTNLEILDEVGPVASKFSKHIQFMRFTLQEAESDRQLTGVKVIVLYGQTGTGKTYSAINYIAGGKDYYICQAPSHPNSKVWFDGYEGQHTLILDDFAGSFCDYRYLLRLLDCYKFTAEVKGGFSWASWTTVVITTNVIPSAWYSGVNLDPLARRISEIRFCEHQGTYKLMDFYENILTDDFIRFATPLIES